MDMIYQTIKNLLKAIVNLFVAVIELFSGVFNWLASLLLKLRPNASGTKDETTEKRSVSVKSINSGQVNEALVQQIRDELRERIAGRDAYILARAGVEVFEQSHIRKAFAGRRKRLINSITKELLETEFQNSFSTESVEPVAEDTKIQAICEVGKEAIG